ncbi:MAG: DUF1761 domain-containing protein [Gammaproteobacteria bacterium]|nr:DUF1761 domain-containing protein [Gammaproteobacteria bacterium]MDH4313436.1 DUF1761 domain-containing protein [Gammaproteobacteria bacterium]MDH5213012.1 DUF1761 domain-containing protein [Gammaproteobacteria bacterium]MDH5502163.1 DUF1761 domain-containing protein [Gammaproteobacteria bacterium]
MGLSDTLASINWLAVIAATAAAFALGGLWYSKYLFGNAWMQEVGLTQESRDNFRLGPILSGTALLQFVSATALAVFLGPGSTWLIGLQSGLIVGVCWLATAYGITYLFEQRSLRLFGINAGYYMAVFAMMATIIGAWH